MKREEEGQVGKLTGSSFLFQTYVIQRTQFRHMGGTQGTRAAGRDACGVSTVDSWTGCSGDPNPERSKRANVF